jgi:hypothetical protein
MAIGRKAMGFLIKARCKGISRSLPIDGKYFAL